MDASHQWFKEEVAEWQQLLVEEQQLQVDEIQYKKL